MRVLGTVDLFQNLLIDRHILVIAAGFTSAKICEPKLKWRFNENMDFDQQIGTCE